jgi:hypothetical protein
MDSAVVKVCGPHDCTTPIFSNYLRHSALPKLSISPNPTTHEVRISSDMDLGSCSVILYSELGEALVTKTSVLSRTGPVAISLESYPKGRYYLTIQADSGYKKSFTVLKD